MKAGQRVGPYTILRWLGEGSMGAVYAVGRPDRQEIYALKTFTPGLLADPTSRARLSVEMRAQAQLDHPNLVPIVDLASDGDVPYIVMELVEGDTLKEALARGLELERGVELLAQVADGLAHVHEHGILHRDVKPANVLIDEGRARLSDFGISRIVNTPERLTQTGEVLGTPGYMAPELIDPSFGAQGPATDVYSVGAILYELLTGERPFRGASLIQTFDQIMNGKLVPPRRKTEASIPPELEALCLKALARDPAQRFPTAAALGEALRQVELTSPGPRSSRLVAVVGVVGLAIGAAAVGLWAGATPADPSPASASPTPAPAPTGAEAPVPPWIAAARRGEFRTAASLATDAPARTRARLFAWAGDGAGALAELSKASAEWRPALAWELNPVLGITPPSLSGAPNSAHLELAMGEAALGSGDTALARLMLRRLLGASQPLELRLSATLAHARACLGEGDLPSAATSASRALALAPTRRPWLRIRALEVAEQIARADPDLVAQLKGYSAAEARAWSERPVRTRAETTRRAVASAKDPQEVAQALAHWRRAGLITATEALSFLTAEGALLRSGVDGPAGLLVGHAATLAGCAERGNDVRSALAAERLLHLARRLRPASPTLELALSRVYRVQRKMAKALEHAQAARALSRRDPFALLELGRALTATAEGGPGDGPTAQTLFRATALLTRSPSDARERHQQVALVYARAADAFRRALVLAERSQNDPAVAEARLDLARALRSQVLALAFAGQSDPALTAEQARVLRPILSQLDVRRAAQLRHQLIRALASREEQQIVTAEEEALKLTQGSRDTTTLTQALRLVAQAGGKDHRSHHHAYLLLNGDLPVRALAWFRRSAAAPNQEAITNAVTRAYRLSRNLVAPPRLGYRALQPNGLFRRLPHLADLAISSPELIPFLLRFYQRDPRSLAEWDRTWRPNPNASLAARHLTHFARAILLRGWVAPPELRDLTSRRGATLCMRFLKRTPLEGSVHLIRAMHLWTAGQPTRGEPDPDVAWAIQHHLACAEAERPWSFGATQAGLWVGSRDRLPDRVRIYQGVGGTLSIADQAPAFVPEARRATLRKLLQPLQSVRTFPADFLALTQAPIPHAELYLLGVFGRNRGRIRATKAPWREWLERLSPHVAPVASLRLALERSSPTSPSPVGLALRAHWASAAGGRLDQLPKALMNWEVASTRMGLLVPLDDGPLRERWFSLHFSGEGRAELIGAIPARQRPGIQADWPTTLIDPWGPESLNLYTLQLPHYQEQVAAQGFRTGRMPEGFSALQRAVYGRPNLLVSLLRVGRRLFARRLRALSQRQRRECYEALLSFSTRLEGALRTPRRPVLKAFQADALVMIATVSEPAERAELLQRAKRISDPIVVQAYDRYENPASLLWRRVRIRALLGDERETTKALTALEAQVTDVRLRRATLRAEPLLRLLERNSAAIRAFVQATRRAE